jgi:hypothetical protein
MAKTGWGAISALFIKADATEEIPVRGVDLEPDPELAPDPVARSSAARIAAPLESARRAPYVPSTPRSAAELRAALMPESNAVGGPPVGSPAIPEGRPFEEIYAAAGVPVSPYPVEKLLAVVTGLSAMPEPQIRMCVTAMDAADESWTIEDPVADARIKIDVLKAEKQQLLDVVAAVEADGKNEIIAADTHLAETAAFIKEQIDQLQAQLHEQMDATSAAKASIDASIRAAREACARESLRLESEIGRLNRVPNTFGSGLTPAPR